MKKTAFLIAILSQIAIVQMQAEQPAKQDSNKTVEQVTPEKPFMKYDPKAFPIPDAGSLPDETKGKTGN